LRKYFVDKSYYSIEEFYKNWILIWDEAWWLFTEEHILVCWFHKYITWKFKVSILFLFSFSYYLWNNLLGKFFT
jgi:hypothetical protein